MKTILLKSTMVIIVWTFWLAFQGYESAISNLLNHLEVAITMLFGSFVAGSTSVGGGAVAFPVFTKILNVPSQVTLVFSLAIQSIGMTAAGLIIFITRMPVDIRVLLWSIVSGGVGIAVGLFFLGEYVVGAQSKIAFSLFSFIVAIALIIARSREANTHTTRDEKPCRNLYFYLSVASFFGGVLSGLIGTGIDFVIFALMIFLLKSDLKQAVATSVCVMAINAVIGFALLYLFTDRFSGEVVNYWLAAVPVVVVGAPLGALACRYFHKDVILCFLLLLIAIDVVSTVIILGNKFSSFFIAAAITIAVSCCCLYWLKLREKSK